MVNDWLKTKKRLIEELDQLKKELRIYKTLVRRDRVRKAIID